jgi:hypothetical protein
MATRRAMEYWAQKWDWECPLLFGVQLDQLKAVLASWPRVEPGTEAAVALCASSAWNELLYGASAVRPQAVALHTGISASVADQISEKVFGLAKHLI